MIEPSRNREDKQLGDSVFRAAFASLHGHVALIGRDSCIVAVNKSWRNFAKLNGGTERATGVGVRYFEVCDGAAERGDLEAAKCAAGIRAVLNGNLARFEMDYICAQKWYQIVASPLLSRRGGAVISHVDIGRRRSAEMEADRMLIELSHAERVTLLGRFTASLTHELNQPLTAISANAEAGALMVEDSSVSELRAVFRDISTAASRAGNVIRKLRVLLRKGPQDYLSTDLNRLVQETRDLVRMHDSFADVKIRLRLARKLPMATVDPVQIQQVLLNLIHNSAEAMQAIDPFRRRMSVRTLMGADSMIVISVADSGPGIAAKDLESIFEAFVTSKPDGMGMGLHVSRSIVIAHGGRMWACGRRGGGSKMCFSLPIQAVD
jgi:signal transduction histidine kinase